MLGSGEGRTKKAAEQQAAEAAWRAITAESNGDMRDVKDDDGPEDDGPEPGPARDQ
jgi:ribonuclease-3